MTIYKYSEILTGEASFFAYMQTAAPTLYTAIFGTDSPTNADYYFTALYGNRLLIPTITDAATAQNALNGIFAAYGESWQRIAAALSVSYGVDADYKETTTKTGTDATSDANNTTNVESTKPFNATDFVDSGKNTQDANGTRETTYNTVTERAGYNGGLQEKITREIDLRRRSPLLNEIAGALRAILLPVYMD